MTDDIEHLKINKLEPEKPRKHLHVLGVPEVPPNDVTEASFAKEPEVAPSGPVDVEAVRDRIVAALKTVFDPEIPVNIYELGLIYAVDVQPDGKVQVDMTLTAPACPVAGSLVTEVARKVGEVEGVSSSHVELVWDPPWSPDRMSDEAKLELGLF